MSRHVPTAARGAAPLVIAFDRQAAMFAHALRPGPIPGSLLRTGVDA